MKGAKAQADLWTSVHLQTFFTGPKRAIYYFCVSVSTGGSDAVSAAGDPPTPVGRGRRATMTDRQQTHPEDQMMIADITQGWSLQQEEQEKMQKVMEEGILYDS
ncbi:hypothetical protein NW767_015041 [Fusarium falciforme]|nr:hypothetical protein NW767_015041 [Fusarium falciforme]